MPEMRITYFASVAKDILDTRANEDAAFVRGRAGLYAVSDGASESFAPRDWAQIIARRYVEQPSVTPEWLRLASCEYNRRFNRASMTWSAQASFDRGSYATLLGAKVSPSGKDIAILAIGDSLAVLTDGESLVSTHPYNSSEQFRRRPTLLSTISHNNSIIDDQRVMNSASVVWALQRLETPSVLLMTDALGAWLLEKPVSRIAELLSLRTRSAFRYLVEKERVSHRMRKDDSTLIIIRRSR